MAQDPLSILCIEPHFPGRLGATADWPVRKRGGRHRFDTTEAREPWPSAVGQGLDLRILAVRGEEKYNDDVRIPALSGDFLGVVDGPRRAR